MARYEGMDEILQRVRERLSPEEVEQQLVPDPSTQFYPEVIETTLRIVREAAQLREQVHSYRRHYLAEDQRAELAVLLEKALGDISRCRDALS